MSNQSKDELQGYIRDAVSERWQLPTRPDLEKDCVDYVWDVWDAWDGCHGLNGWIMDV